MIVPARYIANRHAFTHGYQDAQSGHGDFGRRSYKIESGERAAYMAGRQAWFAEKRRTA